MWFAYANKRGQAPFLTLRLWELGLHSGSKGLQRKITGSKGFQRKIKGRLRKTSQVGKGARPRSICILAWSTAATF